MNKYIKMFMDDHNLKVEERFKLCDEDEVYHFDEDEKLKDENNITQPSYFVFDLLWGTYEIEKLKKEPWKPKNYEKFWFINVWGKIEYDVIYCSGFGDYLYKHTKLFQTQEEAEDYKWFLDKVDEYKKPFSFNEDNYFFWCDSNEKIMDISSSSYVQYQGTIFFGSRKNVENFIEKVGKDRIKKYMFGIYE